MIDLDEMTDAQKDYLSEIIYECATEAGFAVSVNADGEAVYLADIHGQYDVTEQVYGLAIMLIEKLFVLSAPTNAIQQ